MNQCRKTDFSDNWGDGKEGGKKKLGGGEEKVEIASENEITKRNFTRGNHVRAPIFSPFLIRTAYVKFQSGGLKKCYLSMARIGMSHLRQYKPSRLLIQATKSRVPTTMVSPRRCHRHLKLLLRPQKGQAGQNQSLTKPFVAGSRQHKAFPISSSMKAQGCKEPTRIQVQMSLDIKPGPVLQSLVISACVLEKLMHVPWE